MLKRAFLLGKLEFMAERDKARESLDVKYDIRKFHDAMLLPGPVPLELLDHLYPGS